MARAEGGGAGLVNPGPARDGGVVCVLCYLCMMVNTPTRINYVPRRTGGRGERDGRWESPGNRAEARRAASCYISGASETSGRAGCVVWSPGVGGKRANRRNVRDSFKILL